MYHVRHLRIYMRNYAENRKERPDVLRNIVTKSHASFIFITRTDDYLNLPRMAGRRSNEPLTFNYYLLLFRRVFLRLTFWRVLHLVR
jgi:hypothetical protein